MSFPCTWPFLGKTHLPDRSFTGKQRNASVNLSHTKTIKIARETRGQKITIDAQLLSKPAKSVKAL
tara:strand:+ start:205 stop:402 length:198 start_codon:yes stop_codon:yes gene_type:complete